MYYTAYHRRRRLVAVAVHLDDRQTEGEGQTWLFQAPTWAYWCSHMSIKMMDVSGQDEEFSEADALNVRQHLINRWRKEKPD